MMNQVNTIRLPVSSEFSVDMPAGASVLGLLHSGPHVYMSVLVDPDKPIIRRDFIVVIDGKDLPIGVTYEHYVGTFKAGMIAHVFETQRSVAQQPRNGIIAP